MIDREKNKTEFIDRLTYGSEELVWVKVLRNVSEYLKKQKVKEEQKLKEGAIDE